jgi:hypothetical protein
MVVSPAGRTSEDMGGPMMNRRFQDPRGLMLVLGLVATLGVGCSNPEELNGNWTGTFEDETQEQVWSLDITMVNGELLADVGLLEGEAWPVGCENMSGHYGYFDDERVNIYIDGALVLCPFMYADFHGIGDRDAVDGEFFPNGVDESYGSFYMERY